MSQTPYYQYGMRNPYPPQSQFMTCFTQDGKVMSWSAEGTQQVGVAVASFEELQQQYNEVYARCQEYYEALIREQTCPHCNGTVPALLVPERTPEQIVRDQAEALTRANQALQRNQELLQEAIAQLTELKQGGKADESALSPDRREAGPGGPGDAGPRPAGKHKPA